MPVGMISGITMVQPTVLPLLGPRVPRSPTPAVQRRAGADTDGKRAAPRWHRHDKLRHGGGRPPSLATAARGSAGRGDRSLRHRPYARWSDPDGDGRAEPTGAQVSLWRSSTILLSLLAQHQPHPGERIGVRYRWRDLDHGYHRWMLIVDRPEALDFSPLGGEASDEAPGTTGGAWPLRVLNPPHHGYSI
jgi:hypothetical protein